MILVKNIDQYNSAFVQFSKLMKNNVIKNSYFTKIFYLNPLFKLNGIYLKVDIINYLNEIHVYHDNYVFNPSNYAQIIEKIQIIEMEILNKIDIKNKIVEYDLTRILMTGNIKIMEDNYCNLPKVFDFFIIKISGIWENATHYGLNYKFIRRKM
jgi:hypothetical protein